MLYAGQLRIRKAHPCVVLQELGQTCERNSRNIPLKSVLTEELASVGRRTFMALFIDLFQ
jgi:hypothetical protein